MIDGKLFVKAVVSSGDKELFSLNESECYDLGQDVDRLYSTCAPMVRNMSAGTGYTTRLKVGMFSCIFNLSVYRDSYQWSITLNGEILFSSDELMALKSLSTRSMKMYEELRAMRGVIEEKIKNGRYLLTYDDY